MDDICDLLDDHEFSAMSHEWANFREALRKLLQQPKTVTTCDIHEFCHDAISEPVDREDLIMIETELAKWLESKRVVVEK